MDARRSNAYRRYIALVATAAPSLTERELELLREAADAALFGDADAAEHRASVTVLLRRRCSRTSGSAWRTASRSSGPSTGSPPVAFPLRSAPLSLS